MSPPDKQVIKAKQEKIATVLKFGINTKNLDTEQQVGEIIDGLAGMDFGTGQTYLHTVVEGVHEKLNNFKVCLLDLKASETALKALEAQYKLLGENPSDAVLDNLIKNKPLPGTWTEGSLADVLMHHEDGAWSEDKASRAAELVVDFDKRHEIGLSDLIRKELVGMGFETEPLLCLLALELEDGLLVRASTGALKRQDKQYDDWFNLPSAVQTIIDHDFEPLPEQIEALAQFAALALFRAGAIDAYAELERSGRIKNPIVTVKNKGMTLALMGKSQRLPSTDFR